MEEEFMDTQDASDANRSENGSENAVEIIKDLEDPVIIEDSPDDDDGSGNFRGRGRGGNFRGRGRGMPPHGWMNGPPSMRFRGRGYGPGGPPMRGRGFFRGRGGPRFNNGPNFDNNWGPMGPPPPGMMGGPPPFGPPPGMMPPGGPMGPPPNMMGQPPFGGPPGMPPPNMPAPDLWVETKSEEGKSYYYHARTRETTWTRPQDSPTCKVITQAEMEAMVNSRTFAAASQAMQMGGGPMGGPPMGGPPMGMMNGMMGGMMPPGVGPQGGGPAAGSMPPYMGQLPPWANSNNKDGDGKAKKDDDGQAERDAQAARLVRLAKISKVTNMSNAVKAQAAVAAPVAALSGPVVVGAPALNATPAVTGTHHQPVMSAVPVAMGNMPAAMSASTVVMGPGAAAMVPGQAAMGPGPGAMGPGPVAMGPGAGAMGPGPGAMGPGPGAGAGPGGPWGWGWTPPIAAQAPARTAAALPDAGAATQQRAEPESAEQQPPATVSRSKDDMRLSSALAARASEWTTHTAPDGRLYYYHAGRHESVWEKPKCVQDLEDLITNIATSKKSKIDRRLDKIKVEESAIEVIDVEAHAEAAAAAEAAKAAAERERVEKERAERERVERELAEKEKTAKEKEALADRSRPKTSIPISGTPWCVVWTGDGRVFFYNPTANSSVWERPAQLLGRADVDKAVSQPPDALIEHPKKEIGTGGPTKGPNGELKRSNDSSDESDAEHTKKLKLGDKEAAGAGAAASGSGAAKKPAAAIDAGRDAAIEAEIRAARVRAVVPFEQRVRSFLQLLHESEVSAFSPWEKELHKIVFDKSYLLLNTKERKQVFDRYVRERAEEERKEKNNRLQQKKNDYRALMDEAKLTSKSSFTDFSAKYGREEQFKGIEKVRDRKTYFNEYIAELRKREKEEKDRKREQAKTEFIALLKEKGVDRHARWADAKKKVDTEPRYKAVESSTLREDYFREYCKLLKEERKKDKDGKEKEKEKERDRSAPKKEKKEKEKDKDKEKEKEKDKEKEKEKEQGKEKDGKEKKKKEKVDKAKPAVAAVAAEKAGAAAGESAAGGGDGDGTAEGEHTNGAGEAMCTEDTEKAAAAATAAAARERDRSARAAASIKKREKQVQLALASSLRDREKEREQHKRDEAVQHLDALLTDVVRNPDLTWRDAKKQLKKDHRFTLAKPLNKDDMERQFLAHTSALAARRRERLHALLAELGVTCTAAWRDARALIDAHPAAPQYAVAAQMEREFRDYQREKQSASKAALRQLLQESRAITSRALAATATTVAAAAASLHDELRHDARYTALDHLPEQRQAIITSYLEELQTKGPPPPPTATEPARRPKI